jgi:hypothetical protein
VGGGLAEINKPGGGARSGAGGLVAADRAEAMGGLLAVWADGKYPGMDGCSAN